MFTKKLLSWSTSTDPLESAMTLIKSFLKRVGVSRE